MDIKDFDYELPEELIAQHPVEPRDSSRLLLMDKNTGTLEHKAFFRDIVEELGANDVLVFNDTKVLPARLFGVRDGSGGKVETLLLTPCGDLTWECLVKPGKKCPIGQNIIFSDRLIGTVIAKTDFGGRIIRFKAEGDFEEILQEIGEMPLPPYIHEKLEDKNRYQTVYAKNQGSAAAPTAGLHFTPQLLQELKEKGVEMHFLTLHVGLGTFRPVSTERIEDHKMHSEYYKIKEETASAINEAKAKGKRIIAVGTTSVRTLESAAINGKIIATHGSTSIFIYPGYSFKIVDALITNFHLPQSTLLMLVSAMAGREHSLYAYKEAVKAGYRFFSFGDAMFIR